MNRNARSALHQRRSHIGRRARSTQAVAFFNVLTSPQLPATTEAQLPEHRERLYPPTVTLPMFMRQVLDADGSCQKAVNGWAAQRTDWAASVSAPLLRRLHSVSIISDAYLNSVRWDRTGHSTLRFRCKAGFGASGSSMFFEAF